MDKDEIYKDLDKIRAIDNLCWNDRIANYIEANIDEFIECYEEIDTDTK